MLRKFSDSQASLFQKVKHNQLQTCRLARIRLHIQHVLEQYKHRNTARLEA